VLRLGRAFNQPLDEGVLPHTLLSLELGSCFNKALSAKAMPAGLRVLKLHKFSRHQLPVILLMRNLPLHGPISTHLLPALMRGLDHNGAREMLLLLQKRIPSPFSCMTMNGHAVM
jgi:hypothetical protein